MPGINATYEQARANSQYLRLESVVPGNIVQQTNENCWRTQDNGPVDIPYRDWFAQSLAHDLTRLNNQDSHRLDETDIPRYGKIIASGLLMHNMRSLVAFSERGIISPGAVIDIRSQRQFDTSLLAEPYFNLLSGYQRSGIPSRTISTLLFRGYPVLYLHWLKMNMGINDDAACRLMMQKMVPHQGAIPEAKPITVPPAQGRSSSMPLNGAQWHSLSYGRSWAYDDMYFTDAYPLLPKAPTDNETALSRRFSRKHGVGFGDALWCVMKNPGNEEAALLTALNKCGPLYQLAEQLGLPFYHVLYIAQMYPDDAENALRYFAEQTKQLHERYRNFISFGKLSVYGATEDEAIYFVRVFGSAAEREMHNFLDTSYTLYRKYEDDGISFEDVKFFYKLHGPNVEKKLKEAIAASRQLYDKYSPDHDIAFDDVLYYIKTRPLIAEESLRIDILKAHRLTGQFAYADVQFNYVLRIGQRYPTTTESALRDIVGENTRLKWDDGAIKAVVKSLRRHGYRLNAKAVWDLGRTQGMMNKAYERHKTWEDVMRMVGYDPLKVLLGPQHTNWDKGKVLVEMASLDDNDALDFNSMQKKRKDLLKAVHTYYGLFETALKEWWKKTSAFVLELKTIHESRCLSREYVEHNKPEIISFFGSYEASVRALNKWRNADLTSVEPPVKHNRNWPKSQLDSKIEELLRSGRFISKNEAEKKYPGIANAATRNYGEWAAAKIEISKRMQERDATVRTAPIKQHEDWSKEIIIKRIHDVVAAHSKELGLKCLTYEFVRKNYGKLLKAAVHKRYFGSWENAVTAAGYDYNSICQTKEWDKNKLTDELITLYGSRIITLTTTELNVEHPTIASACYRHFGNSQKRAIRAARRKYAETLGDKPEKTSDKSADLIENPMIMPINP